MRSGDRFGRLTAVRFVRNKYRCDRPVSYWIFRCNCGNEEQRLVEDLRASMRLGRSPCCATCRRINSDYYHETVAQEIGKQYGRLTVIERTEKENRQGQKIWRFQCDCGCIVEKTMDVIRRSIRRGRAPNCGNVSCNNRFKLGPGGGIKNQIISRYKMGASSRGLEFSLTEDLLTELFSGKCHYCGAKPSNIAKYKSYYGEFVYNGIDRVDNAKGYIPDNVVSCCEMCNRAKRDLSYEDFIRWVNRIADYQISKKVIERENDEHNKNIEI